MTRMIYAAVALATVLTTAASARAESPRIVVLQRALPYNTTELETSQGAANLLKRIDGLALRMCREHPTTAFARPLDSEVETCRTKAVARAVTELDAPLVTAAHAERQGAQLAAR